MTTTLSTLDNKVDGWSVSLYMSKLSSPNSFFEGQRATRGGMWFCKGRLGERDYKCQTRTYVPTDSVIGQRLTDQVTRARGELLRIQEIYVALGPDPNLHNANYELEFRFEFDPAQKRLMDVVAYGYRVGNIEGECPVFQGHSVKSVFREYREALEQKFAKQLTSFRA